MSSEAAGRAELPAGAAPHVVMLVGNDVTTDNRDDVTVNNRMRRELATAIAAFRLTASDRAVRLAAAKELQNSADEDALPAISAALARESDPEIKGLLTVTQATIQLASSDRATRLAAIRALAQSDAGATRTLLQNVLAKKASRSPEEEEFVATMQSTWEKAKKIGRDEGKVEAGAHAQ